MELLVTENRSSKREYIHNNVVRIFIEGDYHYGLWIKEEILFNLLTSEQQKQYIEDQSYSGGKFNISFEVAQELNNKGNSPFTKQKLFKVDNNETT